MKKAVIAFTILLCFAHTVDARTYTKNDYFAIEQQDQFVNEVFFKNKRDGVFVDIGAHAGILFSNTYFFEKHLNWAGICIEPSPIRFKQLQNGRNCICVNAAIANENTTMKFADMHAGWTSGLLSKYEKQHAKKWNVSGSIKQGRTKVIDVQCIKLNDLLEEHNMYHIDFLDIDTEGGEFEILQSIDYDKFNIDVICVEVHPYAQNPTTFLESKNYKFVKRLGKDVVYKKLKAEEDI